MPSLDEFLARAAHLPELTPEALGRLAPLLVVAPHPDDESLGCGALVAACRAQGLPVRLVVVSDGAASHPHSRTHPPPRLAGLREAELLAAARELGLAPPDVRFLRLPDAAVPVPGEEGFPAALDRPAAAAAGPSAEPPRTVLVSWRHDPHCDHQASYALARGLQARLGGAPRLLEYPIWGLTLPGDTEVAAEPAGLCFAAGPWLERKRRAVECHASQRGRVVRDAPLGFALTDAMVDRFLVPFELFLEMPA